MDYTCKNCTYKTTHFTDISRHLNKRKACSKKILNAYNYTDEELLKLSLLPNNEGTCETNNKLLKNQNNNILKKDRFFEIINLIDKNKLKECPLCNKSFNKILDLKSHLILECVSIDLDKNCQTTNIDKSIVIDGDNNSINNSNNITNITNNIIINPISFDEQWDDSHLSKAEKDLLIISMFKYSKILESLLKNKSNHNVIIDAKTNSGLVYKNNNIESMSLNEIMDKSFDKLYNHLSKFFEDNKINNSYAIDPDYICDQRRIMRMKYNSFKKAEERDDVDKKRAIILHITDIFDKIKEDTLESFNKISNKKINDDNPLIVGGF